MAQLRPFYGMTYCFEKSGPPEEVTCPPYDIVSEQQRQALVAGNPYNVIRLELPKGENAYGDAEAFLRRLLREGILRQEPEPALYIYSEEFEYGGKRRRFDGVVAHVELAEFSERIILPHEKTLSKAKEDRLNLLRATGCSFSQIYSLFFDREKRVRALIETETRLSPGVCFRDGDGVTHRLWTVADKEKIAAFGDAFREKQLFIADGHHRYETALNFRRELRSKGWDIGSGHPADSVMMTLVDIEDDGLVVFPTHRMVRNLPGPDRGECLRSWGEHFDIAPQKNPEGMEAVLEANQDRTAFGVYFGGGDWYLLTEKEGGAVQNAMRKELPDKSAAYCGLDVVVLHTLILDKLGISAENMAAQTSLIYTKQLSEALEGVRNGSCQASFVLNATKVEQIAAVAEAGDTMPQKSTYFYPKLITGLVMNRVLKLPGAED